jgi:hypothetical protein
MKKNIIKLKENWILYGFETIVIIVGILGAFALESLYDNKKMKETEYKLLNEMVSGLKRDIFTLDFNITLHEGGARACQIILESFAQDLSYHDSLSQYFSMTHNYTAFAPNSGAYESIKSLGLEIIQNDTIRLETIGLYEQGHIIIQENNKIFREQVLDLQRNFNPPLFEEFHLFDIPNMTRGSYGGHMVPTNFEDLKTNKLYLYHLKSLSRGHIARIGHNKMILRQTESLIELITKELNNN